MTLKIRITPRAEYDLTSIRNYIQPRNRAAAERVRKRIAQTIDLVAEFPGIGRLTPKPGVLLAIVPRYQFKIYFTVTGDELAIVDVRHPSRKPPETAEL